MDALYIYIFVLDKLGKELKKESHATFSKKYITA